MTEQELKNTKEFVVKGRIDLPSIPAGDIELKSKELKCEICHKYFVCDHEMSDTFQGQKLKTPHCTKCAWDEGNCNDKHGYVGACCGGLTL